MVAITAANTAAATPATTVPSEMGRTNQGVGAVLVAPLAASSLAARLADSSLAACSAASLSAARLADSSSAARLAASSSAARLADSPSAARLAASSSAACLAASPAAAIVAANAAQIRAAAASSAAIAAATSARRASVMLGAGASPNASHRPAVSAVSRSAIGSAPKDSTMPAPNVKAGAYDDDLYRTACAHLSSSWASGAAEPQ